MPSAKPQRRVPPILLQDTREQRPLTFTRFAVEIVGLPAGDYSLKGFHDFSNPGFVIERKSLGDLAGSLGNGRDRFFREVEKLRQFRFRGLVIEASVEDVESHSYVSGIAPSSILGTLDALAVRAGLHIFWCGDPTGAATKVESLAEKFCRGVEKEWLTLQRVEPAPHGDAVGASL